MEKKIFRTGNGLPFIGCCVLAAMSIFNRKIANAKTLYETNADYQNGVQRRPSRIRSIE